MSSSDQLPEPIESLDPEDQKDEMEQWFRENFEDPAERTPYESAEGGYIWIWGGPYDAKEMLSDEFYESVDEEVIDELVNKLETECMEWAPTDKEEDYADYIADDISSITEIHQNYLGAIVAIQRLLNAEVPDDLRCNLNQLLFVNVITALETYLSDTFMRAVLNDEDLFARFVESNPEFKEQKLVLSEIIKTFHELKSTVKRHLLKVVWHNLSRVSKMYECTLNVEFPKHIGDLYQAIAVRHDIVHRNGKDKEGNEISISKERVENLIVNTGDFISTIDGGCNFDS